MIYYKRKVVRQTNIYFILIKNFITASTLATHTISYFRKVNIMSVEENSTKDSKPKKQTSWIWQYFKEETKEVITGEESVRILVMICQVKENPLSNMG